VVLEQQQAVRQGRGGVVRVLQQVFFKQGVIKAHKAAQPQEVLGLRVPLFQTLIL
jgi:hypothetical protein